MYSETWRDGPNNEVFKYDIKGKVMQKVSDVSPAVA